MLKALSKQSTEAEIKDYFCAVLNLSQSDEVFPVNLDDVWPLVFGRKEEAVRALKNDKLFILGIDYQVLRRNAENHDSLPQEGAKRNVGGRPSDTYMLSLSCLEFFIARKVHPVFEVYRQVFHKVAEKCTGRIEETDISQPCGLEYTISPLSEYMHTVDQRFDILKRETQGSEANTDVWELHYQWVATYRRIIDYLTKLVQYETISKIEGAGFININR